MWIDKYPNLLRIARGTISPRNKSYYSKGKTKGIRDSGSKEDEADTVYLLAKELAYDVVSLVYK
ncbi:hypothetical protein [Anaplasma phagocytophilum]|uniref:hypothetical protein n=1 Tax=Anaplasma phagocytophilum TaxID=948 RepID=UPI003977ABA6